MKQCSRCKGHPAVQRPPASAAASALLLPSTLSCSKYRYIVSLILLFTLLSLLSPSFFPSLSLPIPVAVSAALDEGSLYSGSSWQYLTKFCFDTYGGTVTFSFFEGSRVSNGSIGTQFVSFYADQDESWYSVKDDMSCQQKRDLGKARFPLSDLRKFNYSYTYPVGGIRPRWWFVAVSNCDGDPYDLETRLSISYFKIHFTNRPGRFSFEFGKDIQGIPEMSIFFICLYAILMCLCAWTRHHANGKNLQYTVVKFLFASILVEFIALIFFLAHFAKYADDGKGVPQLELAHYLFDATSNLILLDVVLNISKGWTISTKYVPSNLVNLIILAVLGLLYLAIYWWMQKVVDPASTAIFYENEFGWCMVAVRLALLLWVAYCIYATYNLESEKSKRQFYHLWLWVATVWMASLPIIVLSVHTLSAWKRRQVAFASMNSVQATMFILILFLFRPFQSNRYVGILEKINSATVAPVPTPAAGQLNQPSPQQVEAAAAAAAAAANIEAEAEMAVPSLEQQQRGIPTLPIPPPIQPQQQDLNQAQTQEIIVARPVSPQQQQQQQPLPHLDQPQQPIDIPLSSNVSDPVIDAVPLEQNLPNQPLD